MTIPARIKALRRSAKMEVDICSTFEVEVSIKRFDPPFRCDED